MRRYLFAEGPGARLKVRPAPLPQALEFLGYGSAVLLLYAVLVMVTLGVRSQWDTPQIQDPPALRWVLLIGLPLLYLVPLVFVGRVVRAWRGLTGAGAWTFDRATGLILLDGQRVASLGNLTCVATRHEHGSGGGPASWHLELVLSDGSAHEIDWTMNRVAVQDAQERIAGFCGVEAVRQ